MASYTGAGTGPSAATDWTIFNAVTGTTNTVIEAPVGGLPTNSPTSLFFGSTSTNAGIEQSFTGTSLPITTATVWVYLVHGSNVELGIGKGASTVFGASDTTADKWEQLTVKFQGKPNTINEIKIGDPAVGQAIQFYASNAVVTNTAAPSPAAVLPFLGGLLCVRRRRNKR
jgi:hypothetical protein